jgi:protease IV
MMKRGAESRIFTSLFALPDRAVSVPTFHQPLWRRIVHLAGLVVRRLCTALGAIVLLTLASFVFFASWWLPAETIEPLSDTSALIVRLDKGFDERADLPSFADPFAAPKPTVAQVVETLDKASTDNRIKTLIFYLRGAELRLAQVQDLRAAVKRFRLSGKPAIIFSPSYGMGGLGLPRYYLAAAFDHIWMQPVGSLSLNGLGVDMPYFRAILDKFGVHPNFVQRKEFKTAMENITNTGMSKASRDMLSSIFGDLANQVVADIADDRKISEDKIWTALNKTLLTDREAKSAGLIDRVDFPDVLLSDIRKKLTGIDTDNAVDFIDHDDYRVLAGLQTPAEGFNPSQPVAKPNLPRVAVISIDGAIFSEEEGGDIPGSGPSENAEETVQAILDATSDDNVKAIIVRLDSPGGSPTASESIRRALVRAKTKGKKIVVSMGTLCASGGYWVATAADHIFARGATLTGSIGVFGGKFDIEILSKQQNIAWDGVTIAQNQNIWSMHTPFSFSESERVNALMDNTYDYFTKLVAEGRGLKPAVVERLARGRVWTGAQALELGLIDELGGEREAIAYTAALLKAKDVDARAYPAPKTPIEEMFDLLRGQAQIGLLSVRVSSWLGFANNARSGGVYAVDPILGFMP